MLCQQGSRGNLALMGPRGPQTLQEIVSEGKEKEKGLPGQPLPPFVIFGVLVLKEGEVLGPEDGEEGQRGRQGDRTFCQSPFALKENDFIIGVLVSFPQS